MTQNEMYMTTTGPPQQKPLVKSILADLPAAFTNSITLSLNVVVGFTWAESVKSLFADGGPFFIRSSHAPWIVPWVVAIIMTITAVIVGRLAGYRTSPIATTLPLKPTPPPPPPSEVPTPAPFS